MQFDGHIHKYNALKVAMIIILILSLIQFFTGLVWTFQDIANTSPTLILSITTMSSGLVSVILAALVMTLVDNTHANMEIAEMMRREYGYHKEVDRAPVSTEGHLQQAQPRFNCPFCGTEMYQYGRCGSCGNTIDALVLEAERSK